MSLTTCYNSTALEAGFKCKQIHSIRQNHITNNREANRHSIFSDKGIKVGCANREQWQFFAMCVFVESLSKSTSDLLY